MGMSQTIPTTPPHTQSNKKVNFRIHWDSETGQTLVYTVEKQQKEESPKEY